MAPPLLQTVLAELGLVSLWQSARDAKLLMAQRFARFFAYGSSTLVLVAYLVELGISEQMTGLFMTLTLFGDVGISFVLTLFADALGRKAVMAMGAVMMAGSGIAFALSGDYWVLLTAAIFGVISPSGNEIGPFRAIEESTLAQLTPTANRGDIYAWYGLIGTSGTAFGMIVAGWAVNYFRNELQWNFIQAYRAIFWGYAGLGCVILFITLALSQSVEAVRKEEVLMDPELTPLLTDDMEESKPRKGKWRSLLPDISSDSKIVVVNLCVLFALDSFASGLAPISWVTYFFRVKFSLAEEKLGSVFFPATIMSAFSMILAASIAKRFGNIRTMVFTHLPSSIFLSLIPVPNSLPWALVFLVLWSSTRMMDTPPRTAFMAAVLRPNERTSAMGLINVVKTSAQAVGPVITGILVNRGLFWVSFVLSGILKVVYDLGMLGVFSGHKTLDERDEEVRIAEEDRLRLSGE